MDLSEKIKMKILKLVIFLVVLILFYLGMCHSIKREPIPKPLIETSKGIIGEEEYDIIVKQILDSINKIARVYPEYLNIQNAIEWKIYPGFCFNKEKNRAITALIKQRAKYSSLGYIFCFKNKGKWEFYRPGLTTYYFNNHFDYPDSVAIPMTEMKKYARKSVSGYLKKNQRSNEYEVNDKFFLNLFGANRYSDSLDLKRYPDKPDSFWTVRYMRNFVIPRENEMLWRDTSIVKPVEKISKDIIGASEYHRIYSEMTDDLQDFIKVYPRHFKIKESDIYKIHPTIVFNKEKNKFLGALIKQRKGEYSTRYDLCGFKNNDKWEFFYLRYPNKYSNKKFGYPDTVAIPMEELEQKVEEHFYRYLIKKRGSDEWLINQDFFDEYFERAGAWKPQYYAAKEIKNQKEKGTFWNEAYMDRVRSRKNRIAQIISN